MDSSTWSQLIACNIPIEQSKIQPIVKTLKQNGHADIIRGFLRYMEATSPLALSEDTVHELEQICKENENRPISVPFLEHVASGAWDGLTAAEATAFARELPSLSTEVIVVRGCERRSARRRWCRCTARRCTAVTSA